MTWTRFRQETRVKPKRKIRRELLGPRVPAIERAIVPMEEIRRQGMMLAGRTLGQGVRSRPSVQGGQNASADRSAERSHGGRRGATR